MPRLDAWRRWQAAAGPWRGYVVCPALQLAATGGRSAIPDAVPSLENVFARGPTALVIDLDPVLGVTLAANLSRSTVAHVVLVLPRWPHADAVLPCDRLVATLEATSRWLRRPTSAAHVAFVLDGDRRKTIRRPRDDPRVDNRYDVSPSDLPNLQTLRTAGIRHVAKITYPL